MPEITVTHIAILALALCVGVIAGWVARAGRCAKEKSAINVGWHEQLSAQRTEHDRLGSQNKSLMEQISQYQASNTDGKLRAKELSDALKEAFARRDELQRQIKDIRGNLESAVTERNQLRSDMHSNTTDADILKEKDDRIATLSRELESWKDRLPPLIERYQSRNQEALQLEADLATAREQIRALETMVGSDQTRVEPVDPDALRDGMDASNDSLDADLSEESDALLQEAIAGPDNEVGEANTLAGSNDDEASGSHEVSALQSDESSDDNDPLDTLFDDFHETETNQLLDDLDDLKNDLEHDVIATEVSDDAINAAAELRPNGEYRDNLKLIKGVGPAIEKTLNEMGIARFDQIAEMSEYDIDRIAKRLKGFRSRIYREDWIGQARELHSQKADDQP